MRMKGASEREGERKFRNERWNACGKGKRDRGGKKVRGERRKQGKQGGVCMILRNLFAVSNG